MKKILGMSLAILATITSLVGCNSTASEATVDFTKEGEGEVIWWNNYQDPTEDKVDEETARKSNTYREYYYAKDLIEAFQKEYPNIKITTVYKGSYSNIKQAVDSALTGGGLPCIATCYPDSVYSWNEAGAIQDMTGAAEILAKDSDYNQSYLTIEKSMYKSGTLLTLPYSKSAETFVYNETVFNKEGEGECGTSNKTYTAPVAASTKTKYSVPTNWDELIATAKKIKADFPDVFANQKDSDGYFTAVPFCWDSAENMVISLFKNAGIDYTANGDSITSRVLFNNTKAKELLIQLKKWNNEGLIATQNQLPITNASKGYHAYGSNLFCNGKIFMSVSSTAGSRYFTNDGFLANMTKTLAWSNGSQADAKVISQGPSLAFFKTQDDNVSQAAFTFYKYLTNATNSANLAVNTSYFPLRTSAANNEKVKALTTAAATKPADNASTIDKGNYYAGTVMKINDTLTSTDSYFLSPVTKESADCRTAVGNMISTIFNDKTATTDAEIETLVTTALTNAYNTVAK